MGLQSLDWAHLGSHLFTCQMWKQSDDNRLNYIQFQIFIKKKVLIFLGVLLPLSQFQGGYQRSAISDFITLETCVQMRINTINSFQYMGHNCNFSSYLAILKQSCISLDSSQTRLLSRPQPQMYPPIALNQYTLVNRTHKHF